MHDVTILIKTFERPDSLRRLLQSIQARVRTSPVYIADDSRQPYRDAVLQEFGQMISEYVVLPFDSGLSAGRNAILRLVRTPYFLLCDDDFIFDDRTDLDHMRHLLDSSGLDLLGGMYYDRAPFSWRQLVSSALTLDWQRFLTVLGVEIPRKLYFNLELCGSHQWKLADVVYTPPVVRCDFVSNFFLARTERVRSIVEGWPPALKLGEHRAFFLKAKHGGLKVGHTEEVGVCHLRDLPAGYREFRDRIGRMTPKEFVRPTTRERCSHALDTGSRILHHYLSGLGRTAPRSRGSVVNAPRVD